MQLATRRLCGYHRHVARRATRARQACSWHCREGPHGASVVRSRTVAGIVVTWVNEKHRSSKWTKLGNTTKNVQLFLWVVMVEMVVVCVCVCVCVFVCVRASVCAGGGAGYHEQPLAMSMYVVEVKCIGAYYNSISCKGD